MQSGILQLSSMIIRGDLNFSMGSKEIWGQKSRIDSMTAYFRGLMEDFSLLDVTMVNHVIDIRYYIIPRFISHHFLVMLTWDEGEQKRS